MKSYRIKRLFGRLMLLAVLPALGCSQPSVIGLFLTPDQQGQRAYEHEEFAEANIEYLQPFLPLDFEGGDMGIVGRDAEADEVVFDADADALAEKGKDTVVEEGGMLSDAQLAEMWLRQVDTSTASFLKYKFQYQATQMDQEGQ